MLFRQEIHFKNYFLSKTVLEYLCSIVPENVSFYSLSRSLKKWKILICVSLFLLGLVDKFRAANFWVQLGVTVIPSAWGGGASLWALSHIQKKKNEGNSGYFSFFKHMHRMSWINQEKPLD